MKFLYHIDLSKLELRNAVIQVLSTAPSSPVVGQTYFDSVGLRVLSWTGSVWANKATDASLLNGQNAAFYQSRANHTGTQTASTISDLASVVQGYRLDQFSAPTVAVSFASQRITNLAEPVSPTDAATKNYTDNAVQQAAAGIDSKASVRAVSTTNLTLSGIQTVDGVSLVAGDRVLAVGQTTSSANGVYVVASGLWTRALDADQNNEITPGAFWFVEEGALGKTQWRCNNTGSITLGTTAITIVQFGAAMSYTASNGVTIVGGDFRATTAANSGITVDTTGISIDRTVVVAKYSATIGDGTNTTFTIPHGLNTIDVSVTIREVATGAIVVADVTNTNATTVVVTTAVAPATNSLRVTVLG